MALEGQLERLAAAGFSLLPVLETHFVMERHGFAALVERRESGFGNAGSAGLLTEGGLAVLIWRGDRPVFVRKGFEQAATGDQVEELRRFSRELDSALGSTG